MSGQPQGKQLLHLVFGGELNELGNTEFKDLGNLDIVGMYPNYASAYTAWKAKAQQTVDNAHMRYFIVHRHGRLDPAATQSSGGEGVCGVTQFLGGRGRACPLPRAHPALSFSRADRRAAGAAAVRAAAAPRKGDPRPAARAARLCGDK